MYFPYFRGRQYELLALRELAQGGLLGNHVIPVVEPVKLAKREEKFVIPYKMIPTFDVTVQSFIEAKCQMAIIGNPEIGDLVKYSNTEELLFSYFLTDRIIPSVIMNENADNTISSLLSKGLTGNALLVILNNRDYLEKYREKFEDNLPKYTLCPYNRQFNRVAKKSKVLFGDKFIKRDKNADYPRDEFFSDDHIDYEDENYVGFGDYSIVGDNFVESGYAPYAVVIHIVYFADDNTLRIRHFVSDSNLDTKDVAGKYYEAVTKLKKWYDAGQLKQLTTALTSFLTHAENGYYPGLPTIKKLSIMHHLELVGKYLDGGLNK